jgi:hypothetical protein
LNLLLEWWEFELKIKTLKNKENSTENTSVPLKGIDKLKKENY